MPQTKHKGIKCHDYSDDFEVTEIPDLVCVTPTTKRKSILHNTADSSNVSYQSGSSALFNESESPVQIINSSSFVTPQSTKKDLTDRTPGSVLGSAVKKRLHMFDFEPESVELQKNKRYKLEFLEEFKKAVLIPNCMYAAGFLHEQLKSSKESASVVIKKLPPFFGYYKTQNVSKSSQRVKSQLEKLLAIPGIKSACSDSICDNKSPNLHNVSTIFEKDSVCDVCFQGESHNFRPEFAEKHLEVAIHKFFTAKIDEGNRFNEINEKINGILQYVSSKFQYLDDTKKSAPVLKQESNDIDLEQLDQNVKTFQDHLNKNSAFLHYGMTTSQRQIVKADQRLFCKEKSKLPTINEMLQKLPNKDSFSSSILKEDPGSLFKEYRCHVESFGTEPNLAKLGGKFQLIGKRGGNKRVGLFAQTAILERLSDLKNVDMVAFNNLHNVFAGNFSKRAKYEQFQIFGNHQFPRLPSRDTALEQLQNMADRGEILLGQSQYPQTLKVVDPITSEHKEISVYARKIDFNALRNFTLDKHLSKGYMRAQTIDFYNSLSQETILDTLESYGVLENSHRNLELKKLQKFIFDIETTRHIAVWFDHCTLGNISHIMFTFQLIYNRATYTCPLGISERQLQYEIDRPNTNYIGISSSDTSTERSFSPMRCDDIMTLSNGIKKDGHNFTDIYRLTIGDNPVRCVETAQNKCGNYHCCSLPLHIDQFNNFHDLVKVEHQSIEMLRETANKGNFFDIEENIDLNLQSLNSRQYCDTRKLKYLDAKEAKKLHEKDLCGRQGLPLLLRGHPSTPLNELNLESYEVMPVEPLHDVKGVVKKSLAHLPGSSIHIVDEEILKSIHSIIHKTGDELYLLKDVHSAEDLAKSLIDINVDLQLKFFPDGLNEPCMKCGNIFTISIEHKCIKCSFVGYYRTLAEIQVHVYKNESKRNAHEVLRLHILAYLLFYFLECLERVHSRFSMSDVIRSTWFVNTVYYLPLAYELTNLLSINAGRNEDQFKQVKRMTENLSNNQYHKPNLLLNATRRLEANRYYNGDHFAYTRTSTFSKKVSVWLNNSPQPTISFTKEFLENDKSFNALLERISTFLVYNSGRSYVEINHEMITIPYKSCSCSSPECIICRGKCFPPFGINNIHTSNIKKVIEVKKNVFDNQAKPFIACNNKIDYKKLVKFINCGGKGCEIEASQNRNVLSNSNNKSYSDKILEETNLETTNAAKVRLQISFSRILKQLNKPLAKASLVKNTNMARCITQIYDEVTSDVIMFDKVAGILEGVQNKHKHNLEQLKYDENYHVTLKDYISHVRKNIHGLRSYEKVLEKEIKCLSNTVDVMYNEFDDNTNGDDLEQNDIVKNLRYHQKRILALHHTVKILLTESASHNYICTDFDDGIDS